MWINYVKSVSTFNQELVSVNEEQGTSYRDHVQSLSYERNRCAVGMT